jgi:heat shock protein beta
VNTQGIEQNYEENKSKLRLYVRRVLISDEFESLMPKYLSFIKGIVDSDDIPLNVNRETLHNLKVLKVISKKLVRKTIEMLKDFSDKSQKLTDKDDDWEEEEDEEEESVE